ncbi:MAG: WD40 repeat domain-containing protein, partial [Isosphaeraceae bacterium]
AIGPRPSDRQRSPRHVGQTTASLSDFYAGLNRSIGASTPISTVIDPTGCAIARYVGAAISDVHDSTIRHGVLSPDGRMLATAAYDGIVTLWDAQTGLPLKGFFVQEATGFDADGKRTELPALAFSPTGRYLAVGGGRAGLVRWDTESGEKRFSLGFEVRDMGFLPNSNVILFSHASGFACWDAESGTLRQTGSDGPYGFNGVFPAFSADGRKIAAAQHDHSIGIWNASTLELDALLIGHGDAVTGLAWSPDGKILASAGADRTVRLWDISTGLELVILDDFAAEGMCEKLIFSPDGSILAGYGGRYYSPVILWQAPRDENSPTGRRPSNARSGVRNQASGSSTNPRTSSKSTGSIDVIAGVSSGGSPA